MDNNKRDKLEDFILNNREEFDMQEPSADVWDKIITNEAKMEKKSINWLSISWKVAAAVLIFVASFALNRYITINSDSPVATNDTIQQQDVVIPEIIEAEAYYTGLVNNKLKEIEVFTSLDPELDKDIKYDLAELDSIYISLKDDLRENVANDAIIEAMIQNYRLKLEILEDILGQLNQFKEEKNENKEYEI